MPKIKIEAATEGMVVAADVRNMDDMLLIPAGCELTARQIKVLRTWGIAEIQVEGDADSGSTTLLKLAPEILLKLESELKALFWNYDETNPAQKEVFQLVLRRSARAQINA